MRNLLAALLLAASLVTATHAEPPDGSEPLPPLMVTGYTTLDQPPDTFYVSIWYAPDGTPIGDNVVMTITGEPAIRSLPTYTSDDATIPNNSTACTVRAVLVCDALTVPARVQLLLPAETSRVTVEAGAENGPLLTYVWEPSDAPVSRPRVVAPLVFRSR